MYKPPIVYEVTTPKSHKTIRIVAINHNMLYHPSFIKVAQQVLLPGTKGEVYDLQYFFNDVKTNHKNIRSCNAD